MWNFFKNWFLKTVKTHSSLVSKIEITINEKGVIPSNYSLIRDFCGGNYFTLKFPNEFSSTANYYVRILAKVDKWEEAQKLDNLIKKTDRIFFGTKAKIKEIKIIIYFFNRDYRL